MVLIISNEAFRNIMNDAELFLPIRWDGADFSATVRNLLQHYFDSVKTKIVEKVGEKKAKLLLEKLQSINELLVASIDYYQNGFPAKAYNTFEKLMVILAKNMLMIYQKSGHAPISFANGNDPLKLYRAVKVDDNKPYNRDRVFHTPYTMRSKVSTCRYSIAGHPSLYLGTTLDLCCSEINVDPSRDLVLASAFRMDRDIENANVEIQVIELGIKPQDVVSENRHDGANAGTQERTVPADIMWTPDTIFAYLLWYPLIAACSYIRVNKNEPFAAEYIIPQLLMQWVRNINDNPDQMPSCSFKRHIDYGPLFGIRYFSCASKRASEKGYNYVFPTNGQRITPDKPFCSVLAQAFEFTEPAYTHEYDSLTDCEIELQSKTFDKLH